GRSRRLAAGFFPPHSIPDRPVECKLFACAGKAAQAKRKRCGCLRSERSAAQLDAVAVQQGADLGDRVNDAGNALVVVDGGDEVGGVLGHVHIVVPLAAQQLGGAVGQVGTQHGGHDAVLVSLVELV